MFQPLARLALALVSATAAALILICIRSYDPSSTAGFFAAGCATLPAEQTPCWQGIRPGETTTEQAAAILREHPWVETVSIVNASPYEGWTRTSMIYWTWNEHYPYAEDVPIRKEGIVITDHDIVQQVYLTTGIPFGDLWLTLGGADGGAVDYVYDTQHLRIDNTALYAGDGIAATATLLTDCSDTYPNFWQTPVYLWLQDRSSLGVGSVAYPVYLRVMRTGHRHVRAAFC